MTGIEAIGAVGLGTDPVISQLTGQIAAAAASPAPSTAAASPQVSFGEVLGAGMRSVENKVSAANDLVRRFAIDDSVPLHQVTYALEEARLSVELAMQVRSRLVESYRELMNMQL